MHREGRGLLGKHPYAGTWQLGNPTGDIGKTFNLARPPNLQGQDTDPTGGGGGGRGKVLQVQS